MAPPMVKDRTLSKFNFTMEAFLIRLNLFRGLHRMEVKNH
jgi:hypothetical protein